MSNSSESRLRVSVVLPVYNAEAYLHEAVESVLGQSFSDFELIIINDGSTDGTAEILNSFDDDRIRIFHQKNIGLALTLNRGISLARGQFIARQDADDISLPMRFERQVDYLDSHESCALLGTGSLILEDRKLTTRRHQHPCSNGELQMKILFDSFFVHSSVMIRRSALDQVGAYSTDPERNPPEDFDLWLRLARHFEIANLSEPLVMYREVAGSISRSKAELLNSRAISIAAENIFTLIDEDVKHCTKDLVALLRHSPHHMSNNPDWGAMTRALKCTRSHLIARWPNDASSIDFATRQLMRRIQVGQLRTKWCGKYALRGLSFVRRFF